MKQLMLIIQAEAKQGESFSNIDEKDLKEKTIAFIKSYFMIRHSMDIDISAIEIDIDDLLF